MFAKTALIATIAVAAQAITLQATGATFADFGNLADMDSFEEAMGARTKFVEEQKVLSAARMTTAHIYFNARDKAAETVRLEGEFNAAWLAAVKVHDASIEKHEGAKADAIAAKTKKRNAIHAKLMASEAATAAEALKLHALANWNDSKLALKNAQEADAAAEEAHNNARLHHESMSQKLADAEAHHGAMKAEYETREKNHNGALATEAEAAKMEAVSRAAHKAARKAEAAADAAERVAARARSASLKSFTEATEDRIEAEDARAAALAKAKAAGQAVRTHMQANWMYAL